MVLFVPVHTVADPETVPPEDAVLTDMVTLDVVADEQAPLVTTAL